MYNIGVQLRTILADKLGTVFVQFRHSEGTV